MISNGESLSCLCQSQSIWARGFLKLNNNNSLVLRAKILLRPANAVIVGSAIHSDRLRKISVRRWRWRGPLQRGGFPRIVVDFFAVLDAPEEIDDERNLGQSHDPRCPRDRLVPLESSQPPNRVIAGHAPALATIVPTPVHPEHALQEHRQENHVHADEGGPEMHFAPEFVHHSSGSFRKPVISRGK